MSDVDNKVKMIVEGLLLAAGRPLSLDNIIAVFSEDEKPDRKELKAVMDAIAADCDDRGFELKEVASGFRFQVKQDLSEWVAKLWEEKPPRYTRALLETLALIAYRQPITRGDIEEIRGVAVSANIIRTLLDREWVRVVGHRDVPGRPAMFATTKQFLDYFNLKNLQELPPLSEVKDLDKQEQKMDLEDDLADQRVIDLPEEPMDENSVELSDGERAELLAEEEAIELARKPLDEILSQDPVRQEEKLAELMDDEDSDSESGDQAQSAAPEDTQDEQQDAQEPEPELAATDADAGEGEFEATEDIAAASPETASAEPDALDVAADDSSETETAFAGADDELPDDFEIVADDSTEEESDMDDSADSRDKSAGQDDWQEDTEPDSPADDDGLEPFSRSGNE